VGTLYQPSAGPQPPPATFIKYYNPTNILLALRSGSSKLKVMNEIKPGLYEAIITQRLSDALKASGLEHERAKLGK